MTVSRIESLTWWLIYGGMALCALGYSLQRGDTAIGWILVSVGVVGIVAGAALVYVRSRMRRDDA